MASSNLIVEASNVTDSNEPSERTARSLASIGMSANEPAIRSLSPLDRSAANPSRSLCEGPCPGIPGPAVPPEPPPIAASVATSEATMFTSSSLVTAQNASHCSMFSSSSSSRSASSTT